MKLIHYADSSWLLGDEAADLLIEYSVLMARGSNADSVEMAALDADGIAQTVSLVIGPATMMTVQNAETAFPEPENAEVISDVRSRMAAIATPPAVTPTDPDEFPSPIGEYEF